MQVRSLLSIAAVSIAASVAAWAQGAPAVTLPPSPAGQAAVQLGGTWDKGGEGGQRYRDGKWVVVDYGRPLLRGRQNIFGGSADYGQRVMDGSPIWRAGANDTTRLTTQAPLQIGGKSIKPGVYSVFVDLKPGNWTFVLSTQPVQEKYDPNDKVKLYGAYNYDAKFEVLRAPMTVKPSDVSVEQFTIAFLNVTGNRATLAMSWEKTLATIDLTLDGAK